MTLRLLLTGSSGDAAGPRTHAISRSPRPRGRAGGRATRVPWPPAPITLKGGDGFLKLGVGASVRELIVVGGAVRGNVGGRDVRREHDAAVGSVVVAAVPATVLVDSLVHHHRGKQGRRRGIRQHERAIGRHAAMGPPFHWHVTAGIARSVHRSIAAQVLRRVPGPRTGRAVTGPARPVSHLPKFWPCKNRNEWVGEISPVERRVCWLKGHGGKPCGPALAASG